MPDDERFDDITDTDLLAEIWRRFGENWCSFSSGVRSRDECPICNQVQELTRHHLVPLARGGGRDKSLKSRYVKLCRSCHNFAHATWGPGHDFRGPTEREIFVRDLKALLPSDADS